jgi:signal transduction histidine kinase
VAWRPPNDELVRLRAADRDRIAAEERAALARDIHDVVAHHVSAMVIRAQAADRLADSDPDGLHTAVQGIAADGKEALASMRRVVRVLRTERTPTDSIPLVDAIEHITARVRDAGIEVDSDVRVPGELTEFEEATVLRITQEALTNVLLHSRARRVRVGLTGDATGLHLEVLDDGAPGDAGEHGTSSEGGNGLRGMRERAAALGGSVTAGPVDGGWRVAADLPVGEGRAA